MFRITISSIFNASVSDIRRAEFSKPTENYSLLPADSLGDKSFVLLETLKWLGKHDPPAKSEDVGDPATGQ